jgi:hypothetical protein
MATTLPLAVLYSPPYEVFPAMDSHVGGVLAHDDDVNRRRPNQHRRQQRACRQQCAGGEDKDAPPRDHGIADDEDADDGDRDKRDLHDAARFFQHGLASRP